MKKFAYNYEVFRPHHVLISNIVEMTGCETYLELGIYQGINIEYVSKYCKRCIGVDITDEYLHYRNFEFYKMTTDEFFKNFKEKVDVIFIDGDHHFEQVKKDFQNSINILNDFGIIFLHDTDPIEKIYMEHNYCGDVYKIHDYIKENHPEFNIITLPIDISGISIVTRNNDRRFLKFN